MPGLDGQALHARLAAWQPDLLNRLIWITGDTLSPTLARFLTGSHVPVLEKPLDPATLGYRVREHLERVRTSAA